MGSAGVDAERALIGSVLLTSGRVLDELDLDAGEFASPAHEGLWRLMLSMRARGEAVDLVTTAAALRTADETLRRQVDAAWLARASEAAVVSGSADSYAQIVREEAVRRRMREAAMRIGQMVEDEPSVEDLVDLSRAAVDGAAGVATSGVRFVGDEIHETIEDLSRPAVFTPTPWADLNHLIGGWRPGGLYVIGARPGSGKTLVALQAAVGLAQQGAVAFSSLEMSRQEVHKRIIAHMARVGLPGLVNSDLTETQWRRVREASDRWAGLQLAIDDRSGVTVGQVKGFARSVARRRPLAAVVVDYLQLMQAPRGSKRARHELVADWSRQLKIFAREMGVPVILLSQLNRASASREDRRPEMSDLRESGAIEQDADVILLLHRDGPEADLDMLVAKNRHGQTGPIQLAWHGAYATVGDAEWRPAA